MKTLPTIRRATERMLLRCVESRDEGAYVRMVRESMEAWRPWIPAVDPALTPEERFRREWRRGRTGMEAGTSLRLAAIAEDGSMIGLFALNEIVRGVFQNAYGAWMVGAAHMGRGFGTEGVRALLDIAFAEPPNGLALHRVQANIMPANAPSLRIAEKIGFRREGIALSYLRIAGRWEDHVMHALTRDEWVERAEPVL